ncbi:MAG: nuclear transport factor 2 family protein [Candidatus Thermoplasmatota archaeon]|nr:nuclear transport factor 2 family protein [Candidatus Thermoplasmatota archaeon]
MKTPAEFVEKWMETICSNNVATIVSLYKEEAVLLGTLDGKLRKGHSEIKEYFDFFVKLQPCGQITSIVEEDFGHRRMAVANGTYDFELIENGEKATAPARFTFVLERIGTKWKIHSHHSSKQP